MLNGRQKKGGGGRVSSGGKNSEVCGRWAERGAAFWLWIKGYRILHRRWCYKGGEIDIIAARHQTIRIIEVKYRRRGEEAGWESLTAQKWNRLYRGSQLFCARYGRFRSYSIQFDIILMAPWRWPKHFENVWHQEAFFKF